MSTRSCAYLYNSSFSNHAASLRVRSIINRRKSRRSPASIEHSRMMKTDQPRRLSAAVLFLSRKTFPSIFGIQYDRFERGRRASWHSWPCQKQPWTNTTIPYFGNTRSGRPGRCRLWRLYLKPAACTARLTAISGAVLLLRMAAMFFERLASTPPGFIEPDCHPK